MSEVCVIFYVSVEGDATAPRAFQHEALLLSFTIHVSMNIALEIRMNSIAKRDLRNSRRRIQAIINE